MLRFGVTITVSLAVISPIDGKLLPSIYVVEGKAKIISPFGLHVTVVHTTYPTCRSWLIFEHISGASFPDLWFYSIKSENT